MLRVEGEPTPKEISWQDYLARRWDILERLAPELAQQPDVISLKAWIKDRVERQPSFSVKEENLTDGAVWIAEFTNDGQVRQIRRSDNTFFKLEGIRANKKFPDGKVFAWNQPMIIYLEKQTSIPVYETLFDASSVLLPVNGYVGVVSDTQGKVLMRVDQEVVSENENSADVILAIQASAGKIELLRQGYLDADRNLATLLEKLTGGDIKKLLDKPDCIVPASPEDPNLTIKHNLFIFPDPIPAGFGQHEELVSDGVFRWCSRLEIDALCLTRLMNAHAFMGIRTWEALQRNR